MARSEHSTYVTTLESAQVKSILSSLLSGASVEPLNQGPLDAAADIAIVASQRGGLVKKSPFGQGNAVAQVIVENHGATRQVELIAVANTFAQGMNAQRAAGNAIAGLSAVREAPNPKAGRNMASAIAQALKAADPGLRQIS